jgi:hypothetical protein
LSDPGIKFDLGKPKFGLLPWEALVQPVWVLMFGEQKYETDNWKRLQDAQARYLESAQRHMADLWVGLQEGKELHEIIDDGPDGSKMPLAAHVVCCLLFAMWFSRDKLKRSYDISWVREHFEEQRRRYREGVKVDADGNATVDSATEETRR